MSIIYPYKKIKKSLAKVLPRPRWQLALTAVVLVALGSFGYYKINGVEAANEAGCQRAYGEFVGASPTAYKGIPGLVEWDQGGYHYRIFAFGIQANFGSAVPGVRMDTRFPGCSGNGGNDFVSIKDDQNGDGIEDGYNDIAWNSTVSGYGGGIIKPVDAFLGVPRFPGNDDGQWQTDNADPPLPAKRPPVHKHNFKRTAVVVDDGGKAVINNQDGIEQQMWCVNIQSDYYPHPVCEPDATNLFPTLNGAGYLFIGEGPPNSMYNNCPHGQNDNAGLPPPSPPPYIINCTDGNNFTYYRQFNPDINYANFIGRNPDGTLRDFDLHMLAVQTQPGGFSAYMFMTMVYPIPTPATINIQKTIPSGTVIYEPGDLINYNITLQKEPGPTKFISSMQVTDTIPAPPPVSFQSAGGTAPVLSAPPSGGGGTVTWNLNSANIATLNAGGPVLLTLQLKAENVSVPTCYTNAAYGSGTDAAGGGVIINPYPANAPQICVIPPRAPYLNTAAGDVHAGGRIGSSCTTNGNRGLIRNPADPNFQSARVVGRRNNADTLGSTSQYVLSATNSVSSFDSNNSFGSGNSLTLGNTPTDGFYGTLCRPDLVTKYSDYSRYPDSPIGATGVKFATYLAPVVSPATPLNDNTIYRVPGNLIIGGGVLPKGRNITFVVAGEVYVAGDVIYEGGWNARTDIPAFGVIAGGQIKIDRFVTQVQGLYMSNSVIDACWDVSGLPPVITANAALCGNQLTLSGSFIANQIRFRRTFGDVNALPSGTPAAEQLNFKPELFISPAPGLTNLTAQLRYQGEGPPVY